MVWSPVQRTGSAANAPKSGANVPPAPALADDIRPCGVGFRAEGQTASSRRMISRKRSAMGVKVWYLFQMR